MSTPITAAQAIALKDRLEKEQESHVEKAEAHASEGVSPDQHYLAILEDAQKFVEGAIALLQSLTAPADAEVEAALKRGFEVVRHPTGSPQDRSEMSEMQQIVYDLATALRAERAERVEADKLTLRSAERVAKAEQQLTALQSQLAEAKEALSDKSKKYADALERHIGELQNLDASIQGGIRDNAALRAENAALKARADELERMVRCKDEDSIAIMLDTNALRERERVLVEAVGMSTTWPLTDVLKKLCDAVQHLRDAHQCDGDGHEQYYHALAHGLKYIESLSAALSAAPVTRGEEDTENAAGTAEVETPEGYVRAENYRTLEAIHVKMRRRVDFFVDSHAKIDVEYGAPGYPDRYYIYTTDWSRPIAEAATAYEAIDLAIHRAAPGKGDAAS